MASLLRCQLVQSLALKRSLHVLASYPAAESGRYVQVQTHAKWPLSTRGESRRRGSSWFGFGGSNSGDSKAKTAESVGEFLTDAAPSYGETEAMMSSSSAVDLAASTAVETAAGVSTSVTSLAAPSLASALSGSMWYYAPMASVQAFIAYLHVYQGLPWYAAILCTSAVLRLCLFPIQGRMFRCSSILHNFQPETAALQQRMQVAQQSKDVAERKRVEKDGLELVKRMGCSPIAPLFYMIAQAPFQLACFFGVRDLCNLNAAVDCSSLTTGGFLWVQDLSMADPFFVLPLCMSSTIVLSVFLGAETGMKPTGTLRNILLATAGFAGIFTAQFPAGIQLFWLSNVLMGITLSRLFRIAAFRRGWGIPERVEHPPGAVPDPLAQMRKLFQRPNTQPPDQNASTQERFNFLAKGVEQQLAEQAREKQKSAKDFKGMSAGLAATRQRQQKEKKDSG